jgi:phage tail-like protein
MNALLLLILVVSSVSNPGPMIPKPVPTTPTPAPSGETVRAYQLPSHFSFEIDGVLVAGVNTIEGLASVVVERKQGLDWIPEIAKPYRQQVPGSFKWTPITLKRGLTHDNVLFEWRQSVINGTIERARCTLDTTTPQGKPVEFTFEKCWPVHWEGTRLNGASKGYASETIVIQYQDMYIK